MAAVLRTPRQWAHVLLGYVVIAVALALVAFAQVYLGLESAYLAGGPRVGASAGNPIYLAAVLMIAAVLLAGGAAQRLAEQYADGSGRARLVTVGLGVVGTVVLVRALLLTGSRGPFVGLLCGAGVLLAGAWRLAPSAGRRQALAWSAGLIVLTLALFIWDMARVPDAAGGATTTAGRVLGPGAAERGVKVRLALWSIGLKGFRDRPAFGWGPENYPRIFDRHAGPAVQALSWLPADAPHNQPIEALATMGVAGGLAYGLLWGVLALVLCARVGEAHRLQALTVLGALCALVVHGLTFFDTAGTLLAFSILAAWTAANETPLASQALRAQEAKAAPSWLPAAFAALGAAGVVVATAAVHLPMYRGASWARQALTSTLPTERRIHLAGQSFSAFPPMAPYLWRLVFGQLALDLQRLSPAEQQMVMAFVAQRGFDGMNADPDDARLLMTVLPLLQAISRSDDDLGRLEPYLMRLRQLAPARPQTHVIAATQALERGDPDEALRIIETFQANLSGPVPALQVIRERIRARRGR